MTKHSQIESADDRQSSGGDATAILAGMHSETARQLTRWVLSGRHSDDASVHQVALSSPRFSVGRHPDNNLCLDNQTVSGRHAEMICIQDDIFVRDLNSTNGTFLNGERVKDIAGLRNGDVVQFGNAVYTIRQLHGHSANATVAADVAHEAIAHLQFEKLLNQSAVIPYFQPIVRLDDLKCVGYEVLARSTIMGLKTPAQMFRVATDHAAEVELSCVCRQQGLRHARVFGSEMPIYLNTHPLELETSELIDSLRGCLQTTELLV